jgi:alpha-tubulin suppressor-like RCC1 family protein
MGRNNGGAIGDGTLIDRERPTRALGLDQVEQLVASRTSVCALRRDGSVWCWGSGGVVRPTQIQTLENITSITGGQGHFCALRRDGVFWCWGANNSGQYGDGLVLGSERPVRIRTLEQVVELEAGGTHTCARTADGTTWCWGDNAKGQVGTGQRTSGYTTPQRVTGNHQFTRVVVGTDHSCGLGADQTVWCWGGNARGQLGIGRRGLDRFEPMQMVGIPDAISVAIPGTRYTCVLRQNRTMWCAGENTFGQIGNGNTLDQPSPAMVPLRDVQFMGDGSFGFSNMAQDANGQTYVWGYNIWRNLGHGSDRMTNSSPVRLNGF